MAPATRPSWTEEQTSAVHNVRALFVDFKMPIGTARTPAQRAALPRIRRNIPEGVHLSSTLVSPASNIPAAILDGRIQPGEVPCFFFSTSTAEPNPPDTKLVLYLHGGGNIIGHPTDSQFLPALGNLVKKLGGGIICAPSYRCATVPENTFPASLQDAFTAYQYLLEKGYRPGNMTLGGDSSGGNLAISLTYLLSRSGLPLPSRLALFAPAADCTYNLSDHAKSQADVDVYPMRVYYEGTAQYLHTSESPFLKQGIAPQSQWDASNPLVSTAFISTYPANWPKTLIIVGTADQLIDGSRTVVAKLRESGADVELVEYENMIHAFWVFTFFKECEAAWDKFAAFTKS